jgi:hypothetical protein
MTATTTTGKSGAITLRIGWEVDNVVNLATLFQDAQTLKFDFVIVPLVHPLYQRRVFTPYSPPLNYSSAFSSLSTDTERDGGMLFA